MSKEWRLCPSFSEYEATRDGDVRLARDTAKRKKGAPAAIHNSQGYLITNYLSHQSRLGTWRIKEVGVHRLVADAFIGPRPRRMLVHHMDGNRSNNHLSNLMYVTNHEHRRIHGAKLRGGTQPEPVEVGA